MSSLALTSGWYYICTSYCTPDSDVKIKDCRLSFSLFSFLILFSFDLFFYLSIFRTLGLGLEVICHTVTLVTSDSGVTTLITGLKRRKQKILEQSDIIQHRHHMLTSCFTHGHQGRVHSSQHRSFVKVYKVDYFIKSSLLSFLVLPNIRLPYKSNSKGFEL